MTERFEAIHRLKGIPSNQNPLREFAIDEALHMLIAAGVEENEIDGNSSPLEEIPTTRGFIRRIRKALHPKVSQEDVARKAGLSLAYYQQIEQGKKARYGVSADALIRVAVAVGLDPESALLLVQKSNPSKPLSEKLLLALYEDYKEKLAKSSELPRLGR